MAKPGPPRTPTPILKMRGSDLVADRTGEPKPSTEAPPCPKELSDVAKVVWDQVIENLGDMNVLAVCDGNALERYCRLFVEWRKLQRFIEQAGWGYTLHVRSNDGQLVYDAKGQPIIRCRIQHPEVGVRNKLDVDLLRLEQNFGLTPSARASITLPAGSGDTSSDKSRFFMGAG